MNRIIKFRAWDKKNKRMIYLPVTGRDYMAASRAGNEWFFDFGRIEEESIDQEGLELMQFTGLKDKNGKEIYEGDILEHKYWYKPEMSFQYYPEKQIEVIEVKIPDFFKTIGEIEDAQPQDEEGESPANFMKIKGNIYENPDLLK